MEKTKAVRGELISIKEAAKRCGMSIQWIYAGMRTGTLPFPWFLPSPGKRLIDSADLDDWLQSIKIMLGH